MTTASDNDDGSDFFNLAGSNSNDKSLTGYGCGLPISKLYAKKMNGTITMNSIPGFGTDVIIEMPYIHKRLLLKPSIKASTADQPEKEPNKNQILSDDNDRLRKQVLAQFRKPEIESVGNREKKLVPVYRLPSRYPISESQIVEIASWIQGELPVRISKMIKKFHTLPFSLAIREQIFEAQMLYIRSWSELAFFPSISGSPSSKKDSTKIWRDTLSYSNQLELALETHKNILELLIDGFSDLKLEESKIKAKEFLDDLLAERLAIRLICMHLVSIVNQHQANKELNSANSKINEKNKIPYHKSPFNIYSHQKDRFFGIFDEKFNPEVMVREIYQTQSDICIGLHGDGPIIPELKCEYINNRHEKSGKFNVKNSQKRNNNRSLNHHKTSKSEGNTFKYITFPVEYITTEIIKNALDAQINWFKNKYDKSENRALAQSKNYSIKIYIIANQHDFTIKVCDRGNGISKHQLDDIWHYHYKTEESQKFLHNFNAAGNWKKDNTTGYGVGLPISQVFVKKMGGKINIHSIEGYGTDVTITLPYLPVATVNNSFESEATKSKKMIYPVLHL